MIQTNLVGRKVTRYGNQTVEVVGVYLDLSGAPTLIMVDPESSSPLVESIFSVDLRKLEKEDDEKGNS